MQAMGSLRRWRGFAVALGVCVCEPAFGRWLEFQSAAVFALAVFSPPILFTLWTLVLIGAALAGLFGRCSAETFVRIVAAGVFVLGVRLLVPLCIASMGPRG
ncbi:MAG: hypothetical protein ABSF50_03075 [Burkholderiaceae bacterium]